MTERPSWWRATLPAALCGAMFGCTKPPEKKSEPDTRDKLNSKDEKQREAGIDDVQKEYGKQQ